MASQSRWMSLSSFIALFLSPTLSVAKEPPPSGPPWVRKLTEAQEQALKKRTPIFMYFTKKYCPHCEPIEKNVLPSPNLKPLYTRAAWLYVNRNFDDSPLDKIAKKIEIRFGVSSYPQIFLVHPETFQVLSQVGRTQQAFFQAFSRVRVGVSNPRRAVKLLKEGEEVLKELLESPTLTNAKASLKKSADIVVRFHALKILAKEEPQTVSKIADKLLRIPNDPFRYEVCAVLAKHGDSSAASALEAIVRNPPLSKNPNVLRSRAVEALAKCGTEKSVRVIAPFALKGDVNNSLTGSAVDALATIAEQHPKARSLVTKVLIQSYPPAPTTTDSGTKSRTLAHVRKVHGHLEKLTGKQVTIPSEYDNQIRAKLIKSW